jgi:hypothetical protein
MIGPGGIRQPIATYPIDQVKEAVAVKAAGFF